MESDSETAVLPEVRSLYAEASFDPAEDWLCAWCLSPVARESDRFVYEGQNAFMFSNPVGLRFHILLFARTRGCRSTGVPTLEHTWFPGHAWSFCQCVRCGVHLGWFYDGPQHFAGLIANQLVRATSAMN